MQRLFLKSYIYIISFFLPFVLLGGILIMWRVYPFGPRSILMADQYTQYIQFFNHYYDVLREGKGSLLYTWEEGMGLNFWGTFAYYLSSPISLVVLFFKRDHLPEAFIFMVLIKVGLSGLMMYIYSSKMFQAGKWTKLTFSTLYALSAYSIAYFFNIMWLDSVYLLPVTLLGVENLFKRKYLLFIISLTVLFISNFYMGYIDGLFIFLYFLFRSFSNPGMSLKVFGRNFGVFAAGTLLAGGLSAFITLPAYLVLKSNGSQQVLQWSDIFTSSFGFFELLTKFYNGSILLFGLPNVYCGLLVMLLAPLYFLNSKIRGREKILSFLFLLLLIMSLQINGLNIVWHAFSVPTGYHERFAFVVSFFLLFLSLKSYLLFEKENIRSLFKIYMANVFIIVLLTQLLPNDMSIDKAWLNILLLTVYSLLLYGKATVGKYSRLIKIALLIVVCIDLGSNAYQYIRTINSYTGYSIPRSQYNMQNPAFARVVNELNHKDTAFYRTNSLVRLTPNDSIRYGYKGMTNFNTLSNGILHQFMKEIGYSSTLGARSLTQNQGILTSDTLFGFKYLITGEQIHPFGYTFVSCDNGIYLYKNNFAMPVGFMADHQKFSFDIKEDNPFEKQNELMGSSVFSQLTASSVQYHNLAVHNAGNVEYIQKINPQLEGSIEMVFNVHGKEQLYTLLSAGKGFAGYGETTVLVNGKSLGVYPTFHKDRVLDLGSFSNEKVIVKIVFSVNSTQLTQQLFYGLNIPVFENRIKELRNESLDVTKWTETSITGNINVEKSNMLFLSIPYDQGWKAKVDGNSVPIKKLGGFIGIHLEKGQHVVSLSFLPAGFKVGCIISIISLILFAAMIVISRKRPKDKVNPQMTV